MESADAARLKSFWAQLKQAPQRILLLDYDGTLAPFRKERDEAVPYPGVREELDAILGDDRTRMVIISGRSTEDLLPLLGLKRRPEIWGCHGWERLLPDGRHELGKLPASAAEALEEARRWADRAGYEQRCERKPVAVAFHWRGLESRHVERLQEEVKGAWEPLAKRGGLELHPFDGGLELRCPGRDKGFAVRRIFAEVGEGAVVAYLGDDRTDEDAFAAMAGRGLSILVRREPRTTAAELRLEPPEELLEFLCQWHLAGMLEGKG
jgi:trehalose-phosphatase